MGGRLTLEVPGSRTGLYSKQSRIIKQEGEAGRAGYDERILKAKGTCRESLHKDLLKEVSSMSLPLLSELHSVHVCSSRRAQRDEEALGMDTLNSKAQLWARLCPEG